MDPKYKESVKKLEDAKVELERRQKELETNKKKESLLDKVLKSSLSDKFKYVPNLNYSMQEEERDNLIKLFKETTADQIKFRNTFASLENMDIVRSMIDAVIDDGFYGSTESELFSIEFLTSKKKAESAKKEKMDPKKLKEILSYAERNNYTTKEAINEVEKEINKKEPKEKNDDAPIQVREFTNDLKEMIDRLDIKNFLKQIIEKFLVEGNMYNYIDHKEGLGVQNVFDSLEHTNMLGIYQNQKPEFFLNRSRDKEIRLINPTNVWHICLNGKRINLESASKNQVHHFVPEYILLGNSLFLPAINRLKELQLLERVSLAEQIKQLIAPNIISVGVPANQSPAEVVDLLKQLEAYFFEGNTSLNIDMNNLGTKDIVSLLSRNKMIPNYLDGKNSLQNVNDTFRKETNADEKIDKLKSAIAASLGFPPDIVVDPVSGGEKGEMIKRFARYSRVLNIVQQAIKDALSQLSVIHLNSKHGIFVNKNNINVRLKSIVNPDILDNMEYTVAGVQIVDELTRAVTSVTENQALHVKADNAVVLNYLNKVMASLGAEKAFFIPLTPEEIKAKEDAAAEGGGYGGY